MDLKRRVDDKRREDASDHPLGRLLRRKPNDWQTPSQFRQYMQLCVLNRGNAIAQIVRGARNRPIALNPLNPDWGEVQQMPDLRVKFEYQAPGQGFRTLYPGEFLHLAGMSSDGVKGQSVISFARESLGSRSRRRSTRRSCSRTVFRSARSSRTRRSSPTPACSSG